MLEVACTRCERRGRLQVDRLIAQYGNAELPKLGLILAGDCPKAAVVSISDRCDVFFPKLGKVGCRVLTFSTAARLNPSAVPLCQVPGRSARGPCPAGRLTPDSAPTRASR